MPRGGRAGGAELLGSAGMARLAVVSGGGTGIGRATAGMLAGEGYDVIIVGRRAEVLADAVKWIGPQASAVTADLVEPGQIAGGGRGGGRPRRWTSWSTTPGAYVGGDDSTLGRRWPAHWRATFDSNVLTAVLLTDGPAARCSAARAAGSS